MTGLGGLFTGLLAIVLAVFAIILLILLILMPYYVYCIYGEILKIRKNTDQALEQALLSNKKSNQIVSAYQGGPSDT